MLLGYVAFGDIVIPISSKVEKPFVVFRCGIWGGCFWGKAYFLVYDVVLGSGYPKGGCWLFRFAFRHVVGESNDCSYSGRSIAAGLTKSC